MFLGVGAEGLLVLTQLLYLFLLLLNLLLSSHVIAPFGLNWLVDILEAFYRRGKIQLVVILHIHQITDLHSDVGMVILLKEFGGRVVHEYFLDARMVPVDNDQPALTVSPKGEVSECLDLKEQRSGLLQLF